MGPDVDIASLFPGFAEVSETAKTVVPVRNSPEPPPERLSLTLPVINASRAIWVVVSGTAKAPALQRALTTDDPRDVPAAGLNTAVTTFFADEDAAPSASQ